MDHDRIADEKFGTFPGRTGEGLYFYRVLPLANLEVLYKKRISDLCREANYSRHVRFVMYHTETQPKGRDMLL